MAVEMCKLSLWLVSLDPKLPFSFVDDKVLHGNSLLGLTDPGSSARSTSTPERRAPRSAGPVRRRGRRRRAPAGHRLRRDLATEVNDNDPQRSATTKRRQWREYQELTRPLAEVADAMIAAGLRLGGKPGRALNEAYENLAHRRRPGLPATAGRRTATCSTAT